MLKNAARLCDAKFGNIYRWDGDALHLVATQNVPAAFLQARGRSPLRPSPQDGRGAWRDNVFVERLWRSVKHEEVYLRAYEGVSDVRASIGRYLDFYNGRRPHSRVQLSTM